MVVIKLVNMPVDVQYRVRIVLSCISFDTVFRRNPPSLVSIHADHTFELVGTMTYGFYPPRTGLLEEPSAIAASHSKIMHAESLSAAHVDSLNKYDISIARPKYIIEGRATDGVPVHAQNGSSRGCIGSNNPQNMLLLVLYF